MDRFKARFERNRGHFLVVEGDPPISRGDCDEFQLRMFQACEIPGLIRPDVEEIDGNIAFRYSLQGRRMLSQAMRAAKWSMTDWMTALCRIADILEESRLYLLDAERIRLDDDWIFAGEGWQDLNLVYLPMQDAAYSLGDSLEKLIVRWIIQVPELEGPAVQQVIQIVRSPDFTPASLRRYARGYLADQAVKFTADKDWERERMPGIQHANQENLLEFAGNTQAADHTGRGDDQVADAANYPPAEGWRWFRPSREEPQPLSGLLGIDPAPFDEQDSSARDNKSDTVRRRRIWVLCAAIGLSAAAWRMGYAVHPGKGGLLFSGGATSIIIAGVVWLWNWRTEKEGYPVSQTEGGDWGQSWASSPKGQPLHEQIVPISESVDKRYHAEQTGMLGSSWQADMTQQLEGSSPMAEKVIYYLNWESGRPAVRIPLHDASVVIGRSADAAKHVDDSLGVSRAHVELLQTPEGWKAKDLGSRNGTRLNDTPMVPYESYPLQPEDCLILAESRYRFKRSS